MDRKNFDQMFDDAFDENPDNAEGQPPSTAKLQMRQNSKTFKLMFVMAASLLFGAMIVSLPFAEKAEETKPVPSQAGAIATERTPAQIEKMLFANKGHQQTTVYVKKQKNTLLPMPPPDGPEDHSLFLDPDRYVRNYDFPEESPYEYETIDTKTGRILSRSFKEHIHPSYEYGDWSKMLAEIEGPMPEFSYIPEGLTDEEISIRTYYGKRVGFYFFLSNPINFKSLEIHVNWKNPEVDYQVAENFVNEIEVEKVSFKNGLEGVLVEVINHDAFEVICLYNHVEYRLYTSDFSKTEIIKFMEGIQPAPAPDPSLFEIPEKYRDEIENLKWSISDE